MLIRRAFATTLARSSTISVVATANASSRLTRSSLIACSTRRYLLTDSLSSTIFSSASTSIGTPDIIDHIINDESKCRRRDSKIDAKDEARTTQAELKDVSVGGYMDCGSDECTVSPLPPPPASPAAASFVLQGINTQPFHKPASTVAPTINSDGSIQHKQPNRSYSTRSSSRSTMMTTKRLMSSRPNQQQSNEVKSDADASSSSPSSFNIPSFPLFAISQIPQAFAYVEQRIPSSLPSLSDIAKSIPTPAQLVEAGGAVMQAASGGGSASSSATQDASSSSSSTSSPYGSSNASSSSTPNASSSTTRAAKKTREEILSEIMRVDHAGEYGAQRIYQGQLDVLRFVSRMRGTESVDSSRSTTTTSADLKSAGSASTRPSVIDAIVQMQSQELKHLQAFERLLPEHRIRPTALLPIWHHAAYALGAVSAIMGDKSAMACTVAVEESITEHYNAQLRELSQPGYGFEDLGELKSILKQHRDDEQEHRDVATEYGAQDAVGFEAMRFVIQQGCTIAIYVTKKV